MSEMTGRTRDLLIRSALPRHEAERLLGLVTGLTRPEVIAGITLNPEQHARFEALAARRLAGEPLQYLEGTAAFGPLEVVVDRRVLVPRPETEQLWERAMVLVEPVEAPLVVDLGTGSGCLALATKHARPDARVIATDVASDAASLAAENARRLGLDIDVRVGNLFSALPADAEGAIDLLITNPPYVAESAWPALPVDVRNYEPRTALVAGDDGLDVIRVIAANAGGWLAPAGWLVLEIGEDQGAAVLGLFAGWRARLEQDLAGRDRFLIASIAA